MKKAKVLALIGLPVLLVAAILTWNNIRMLDGISESVNRQEGVRAIQAINAAFVLLEDQMAITVADNANWDDAYENAGASVNAAWVKDNWDVKDDSPYYDTTYILDSLGKEIVGFSGGQRAHISANNYYGDALAAMVSRMPKDDASFETVSSMVRTPSGLAVVSAAPITPADSKKSTGKPRNILVFSKLISADFLEKIGAIHTIMNLKVAGKHQHGDMRYDVVDIRGHSAAVVSWSRSDPGAAVRSEYAGQALVMIFSLLCFLCPVAFVHYRTLAAMDQSERMAVKTARMDHLSGLANRLLLLEKLEELLQQDSPGNVTLAFIDLDGFKAVNDTYDHETGDKLIQSVGAGLSKLAEGGVLSARLGGDEFAFLVRGENSRHLAESIADKVVAFCQQPFDLDGRIASIGASIGLAQYENDGEDCAEIMRRADIAMYDAKTSGRNQWRWFDSTLDEKSGSDQLIANEMRKFLSLGNFAVAYQPIVDAAGHQTVGVEALARWPGNEPLSPERFIPIAEENGMIDMLFETILRTAIAEVAGFPGIGLAINVSALQLNNKKLAENVATILRELSFDANRLELEFTETHFIRNMRHAKDITAQLRAAGVKVGLDDFGIGYASVGYLRELTFDTIKLDRSLAQSLSSGNDMRKIVQGTALIAKGLSATVVAEGIETSEQAMIMTLLGANKLQGYYFAKPMPGNQLRAWFTPSTSDQETQRVG